MPYGITPLDVVWLTIEPTLQDVKSISYSLDNLSPGDMTNLYIRITTLNFLNKEYDLVLKSLLVQERKEAGSGLFRPIFLLYFALVGLAEATVVFRALSNSRRTLSGMTISDLTNFGGRVVIRDSRFHDDNEISRFLPRLEVRIPAEKLADELMNSRGLELIDFIRLITRELEYSTQAELALLRSNLRNNNLLLRKTLRKLDGYYEHLT